MRKLRTWLRAVQWPLLGTLAVLAIILGWLGFRSHGEASGAPLGFWDAGYRSLQIFVMEFNAAEPPSAPATLQIARVLAPVVAGYAAAVALVALFRDEFSRVMLRWRRNHVIVCGSGSQGGTLVDSLRRAGRKVAVVDQNPARRSSVPTVTGDATDPEVLRSAGVRRASNVAALCGSDETNAAVALAVRRAVGAGQRPVTHVHVLDPRLCAVLRTNAIASGAPLEFFTVYEQGARTLLDRHPPFGDPPTIAIVGLGHLGRSVLIEAVRRSAPLRAVVIDRAASSILNDIRRRRPGFGTGCDLRVVDIDVASPAFTEAEFLTESDGTEVDVVYVCLGDDSDSLSAALAVLNRLKETPRASGRPVEVVTRVTRPGGLADLIADTDEDTSVARWSTFDLYRSTLDERLLTGATREAIAAALHQGYLTTQMAAGAEMGSSVTMEPWEALSEEVKEANRAAAGTVGARLRAIDADLIPLTWAEEPLRFSPAEVELLAILEHRRWVGWKRSHGFRAGPSDFANHTNPYLVDWPDLPEEAREWVRGFARGLPRVLADAGQQVVRIDRGLARSLHHEYLGMRADASSDPAAVPWEQLPESLRASNRDQATHIRVKLIHVGFDAIPGEPTGFSFAEEHIETLSRMEHERWVAQRLDDGWSAGAARDLESKESPYLVGWEDLDEAARDIDREFVRAIPRLLAEAGYAIVPDPGATGA